MIERAGEAAKLPPAGREGTNLRPPSAPSEAGPRIDRQTTKETPRPRAQARGLWPVEDAMDDEIF